MHSVDALHFHEQKYYLFQASMADNPKIVVTLRIHDDAGKKVMDDLIAQGGPVEYDTNTPDIVGAHVVP